MKYKKKDYKTWNKSQKSKFLKIAKIHQDADRFIQGSRLKDEKVGDKFMGCFYGCMTQAKDNTLEKASEVMGLPAWIIHVSERIFEGLPKEEALNFPLELLEKIPTGFDTYQLWRDWSYTLLMDKDHGNIKYCGDDQSCIDAVVQCSELFKTEFTVSSAYSATNSAYSAAYSAANSAYSAASSAHSAASSAAYSAAYSANSAYSAYSAASSAAHSADSADSADSHYIWLRDTLYRLIETK